MIEIKLRQNYEIETKERGLLYMHVSAIMPLDTRTNRRVLMGHLLTDPYKRTFTTAIDDDEEETSVLTIAEIP
jgi:hypothetical protein